MSYRRRNVDQFQCLSLCFQIRLRVVVGGVEARVAKPTADERDVDACRDEVDGGGMAEAVWRDMLRLQRWHSFSNSSAGRMTAEVCWKIMQSKDGDEQQKCMDFLRRSPRSFALWPSDDKTGNGEVSITLLYGRTYLAGISRASWPSSCSLRLR